MVNFTSTTNEKVYFFWVNIPVMVEPNGFEVGRSFVLSKHVVPKKLIHLAFGPQFKFLL